MTTPIDGLRVCSAPGSFAIHHDPEYTQHLMTTPTGAHDRLPGIILTTEAKDYDAKRMLTKFPASLRRDWTGYQVTKDDGTKGIAAFVHHSVHVVDWGITLGVRPIIGGHRIKMLVRYPMWLHVRYEDRSYFPIGCHSPKVLFKALQKPYLNNVHAVAAGHPFAIPMGDWNSDAKTVRKALGMDWSRAEGIVSVQGRKHLVPSDMDVSAWGVHAKVADHPSVALTVKHRS